MNHRYEAIYCDYFAEQNKNEKLLLLEKTVEEQNERIEYLKAQIDAYQWVIKYGFDDNE